MNAMLRSGTIYAQSARFDTGHALTDEELYKAAPSIFARVAHDSRSDRFAPIPTIDILNGLRREGFVPVGARQAVARLDDRRDYNKHLIRLRHVNDMQGRQAGDTVMECLLKNANDGSSAYDLMAGLFRIQCLNSLVAQTATIDTVKVRHMGSAEKVMGNVIEGTYRVVKEAEALLEAPRAWSGLTLDTGEKMALAQAAHVARFADAEGNVTTPIVPEQLLRVRRRDDQGNDLWRTFNVVQENVIRGGLRGTQIGTDERGRRTVRRVSTRAVNGIDQDVKLNKALWVLAEALAKHKAAA